ncbi:branched-chain amino acid transport system ATP-binding protein [Amorphus suaedae]
MTVLEVRSLTRHFGGVAAVDDVDFRVGRGEVVAMIGPNGAGKSTCFNLINGQLAPDRGDVLYEGASVVGLGPRRLFRMGISRTFQIAAVFPTMTVVENVQMALLSARGEIFRFLRGVPGRERAPALALLDRVGLAELADEAARSLAYGDVKRLELAVALANRPLLLLMDEPTAGMAPKERADLVALTRRIVDEEGASVLFTEHSMDVVFAFADRILVLAGGRLIADGPPDAVRADPLVQAHYLGTAADEDAGAPS